MAGIGFELYRILHKGTVSSLFKVFFLGAVIVAGPWILSVLSIYFIQKYAHVAISENPALFTVSIVYVYAFSLVLFGGAHYVFSRYIADMLYIEEKESIPTALITGTGLVILVSSAVSGLFFLFNDFSMLQYPRLYTWSLTFLFVTANIIWIMLVYVSLLKEYNKIFFAYLAGVIGSVAGVYFLGGAYGVAGAVLGYGLGQFIIVLLLFLISLKSYPIKKLSINRDMLGYFKKFKYLFALGTFFNAAIWADKIIYWVTMGEKIEGTLYRYFIFYDIPVFLAFMSMIPGLVYFLVISEPIFHTAYFTFMKNILSDNLERIDANKNDMIGNLKRGLGQLMLFQGVWTVGLLLNTEKFLAFMGYGNVDTLVANILFVAVFFHMVSMTTQIYLLYLEFRVEAVVSTAVYLGGSVVLTLLFLLMGIRVPGLSYLLAAFLSSLYTGFVLWRKVPVIDYIVFNRR
jgi:uncharacterized membrane protein